MGAAEKTACFDTRFAELATRLEHIELLVGALLFLLRDLRDSGQAEVDAEAGALRLQLHQ